MVVMCFFDVGVGLGSIMVDFVGVVVYVMVIEIDEGVLLLLCCLVVEWGLINFDFFVEDVYVFGFFDYFFDVVYVY